MVQDISARLHHLLEEEGLPLNGLCPFENISGALIPCRGSRRIAETFPPDSPVQTVIVALFPYRFSDEPGNLSRYARVPDYHLHAGGILENAAVRLHRELSPHRFLPFIDNSPIPEVRAAAFAGLGCIGRHGLLIHPEFGSYVFIGTIVTDLTVIDVPSVSVPARCSGCGTCAAVCPGHCLDPKEDGFTDSRDTCLSAVSQKKGQLTPEEEQLLIQNKIVWGCDRCQDVCPLNTNVRIDPHPCFQECAPPNLTKELLSSEEDLKKKAYGWRGKTVLERNLSLFD